MIVGVGTVKHLADNQEYRYSMPEKKAPLRALLWERLVQHSIRPDDDGGFTGGFLLPYHQALELADVDADFDPGSVVAFAPDDRRGEFSYVSEHVTHDGAIGGLLACAAALREAVKRLEGPWDRYQKWIAGELGRLWKLRGPCPGLGAALTAFGINLGVFVAHDLAKKIGENEDPWRAVGVLLLAPTGKARVRMEQAAKAKKLSLTGQTVAGYLLESDRYVPDTGRYRLLGRSAPKGKIVDTVIIDEASMMTEEMLAAVLEAVGGAKRIILVGDHRQLPPIGAGRPFVDIVAHLQPDHIETLFPKVGPAYAELTLNWRQGPSAPDTRLAAWFAGNDPGPGEEEIFDELAGFDATDRIQVHSWKTADECHELLLKVLQTELKLAGPSDVLAFDKSLGGTESNGRCYFNRTWDKGGVRDAAEAWQILSPVRLMPHGVIGLNRLIHKRFRAKTIEWARDKFRKTPNPLGPEEIVYGDKVISTFNQRRWWEIYPDEGCAKYVANGEIGIAVGQLKGPQTKYKGLPWKLEVEFTSQPRFTYGYTKRDFGEEGEAPLELAYALTVHKAQGSEFGTVN